MTSQIHVRSISLPTKLPSNNHLNFESELEKFKSLTFTSSKELQSGVLGLAEVYNSIEQLAQLSTTRESLTNLHNHQDQSLVLINSCNTIREMFQVIRGNVQSLQSAMRRKGVNSSRTKHDIMSYLSFKKTLSKSIRKSLITLEHFQTGNVDPSQLRVFTEATSITVTIFKSILVYLLYSTNKYSSWKSTSIQLSSGKYHHLVNEVARVDFALEGRVKANGANKVVDGQIVQMCLQDLDDCIEGFERVLERLSNQLIRCRVIILNILNEC